jgi:hypothetical protein
MCNCIHDYNEALKEHGLQLKTVFRIDRKTREWILHIPIQTEKLDSRNRKARPGVIFPAYCPFCGTRQEINEGSLNDPEDNSVR